MSDFIKVNCLFASKSQIIIRKQDIVKLEKIEIYNNEWSFTLEKIVFPGGGHTMTYPISREEYDRLCKELGVES